MATTKTKKKKKTPAPVKKTVAKKPAAKSTPARKAPAKKTAAIAKAAAKPARPAAKKAPTAAKKVKPRDVTGKSLVVVESPAKARTIKKYLGAGFTVKASVGHVMDLPKSKLGVDVENGFEPEYVVLRDKKKVISEIRDAAKLVEHVYLAPDPDR